LEEKVGLTYCILVAAVSINGSEREGGKRVGAGALNRFVTSALPFLVLRCIFSGRLETGWKYYQCISANFQSDPEKTNINFA
jgi:hypothetical protein